MFFTEQEIDQIFEKAGVVIADNECVNKDNHIAPQVLKYLEDKWEKNINKNDDLIEIGKKLLKEIDDQSR